MHPMRQRTRQVTDRAILCEMLNQMDTIHLGIHDEPAPYVVPLNFGYTFDDDLVFYVHCDRDGYKVDLLRRNHPIYKNNPFRLQQAMGCFVM